MKGNASYPNENRRPTDTLPIHFRKQRDILLWTLWLRIADLSVAVLLLPLRTTLPINVRNAFFFGGCVLLGYNLLLVLVRSRLTSILQRHSQILLVDIGLSLLVLMLGGGWRSSLFLYTLTTLVLVAVFCTWKGLFSAVVALAIVATVKDPSPGAPPLAVFGTSSWDMRFGAGSFYIVAGLMLGYIVYLMRRLEQLAILEERNRLSLDLHDGPKQIVMAMLIRFRPMLDFRSDSFDDLQKELLWFWYILKHLQAKLNLVIDTLSGKSLPGEKVEEVASVIREEANFAEELTNFSWAVRLQDDTNAITLPADRTAPLHSYLNEALINAAKHSGCVDGTIELQASETKITITVTDHGCGFCLGEQSTKSTGLRSLSERAVQLQGELSIDTAPGQGCKIELVLER